jgi:peptide/nickel transport system permease protein
MAFGRHILKRIILFVPTFVLLLLLTVILQENMPGDKISVQLDQSEFQIGENQKSRREQYNRMAKSQGMNWPSFYWTLAPANFVNSVALDDSRFDASKKNWLRSYQYEKVDAFFSSLNDHLRQLNVSQDVNDERLYSQLTTIGEAEPERAEVLIASLSEGSADPLSSSLQAVLHSPIGWQGSLPKLKWNGSKNRFHSAISKILVGDWGVSTVDRQSVRTKIGHAIRWTLILSIISLIFALVMAFLLGIHASIHDNSITERFISSTLFGIYAMPLFWLATLLIVFFTSSQYGSWLDIFPSVGIIIQDGDQSFLSNLLARGHLLILPIFCLTISSIAFFYQILLSGNRTEMSKPYFLTARAKGLDHRSALVRHSFLNASYPVIGLLAVIIPGLIGGSLVLEVLFNIPGMGRLMFNSILTEDWSIVTTTVLISGILAFVSFILTDVLLYWINPKKLVNV